MAACTLRGIMIKVFSNRGELWERVCVKDKVTNTFVSSMGRVVNSYWVPKPLHDNGNGYFTFSCAYNTTVYVHRAVAMAFIEGDISQQVNHIDANKAHNNVENLEWNTGSQNIRHAHKAGRMAKRTAIKVVNVLTENQVIELYTKVVRDGEGISATARKMGIPRTTVSSIINKCSRSEITDKLDSEFK